MTTPKIGTQVVEICEAPLKDLGHMDEKYHTHTNKSFSGHHVYHNAPFTLAPVPRERAQKYMMMRSICAIEYFMI